MCIVVDNLSVEFNYVKNRKTYIIISLYNIGRVK